MSIKAGEDVIVPFSINQTDLLAGTSAELVAPVDGFVDELYVIVQAAVTTGGAVTVKVGTTDVNGLSVTVADAATKGTVYSDSATAGHGSRAVSKGDRLQVVPASAFDTAGAINGFVKINTAI
jgi:hypothetical protein